METLVANLSGKIRHATIAGREFLVAPVTLLKPQVLNGSRGPLFYPADEILKSVSLWNGIPLVVYHPTRNGLPVSARTPDIAASSMVGTLYAANVLDDKLRGEAWFDKARTLAVDSRVLNALEEGKHIEVSTGLATDNEDAPEGAQADGVDYRAIARNYKPDHLAILPDQKGACSVADGCGVFNKGDDKMTADEKKALTDGLIANTCCWREDDRETLNAMDDDALTRLVRNAEEQAVKDKEQAKKIDDLTANAKKAETAKEAEATKKAETKPVENAKPVETVKPQTMEEWLAGAPLEIQNTISNAMEIEQREKDELVKQLIVNLGDSEKESQAKRLQARTLPELRADVALLPKVKRPAMFTGATGAPQQTHNEEGFAPFGLPHEYIKGAQ